MKPKGKGETTIKIKRLEIIFLVVYFLLAFLCYLLFKSIGCVAGSFLGFLVSLGDWYLLKIMAKKWIKKGKYSVADYAIRIVVLAISVYLLLSIGTNVLGIFVGVSAIPVSLMFFVMISFFGGKKILV